MSDTHTSQESAKPSSKRKLTIFVLAALLILSFIGYTVWAGQTDGKGTLFDTGEITIQTQSGDTHKFDVEIADEPASWSQGLMWRTQLAPDAGMFFIFEEDADHNFWMKNTLIPLDMLFIKSDGRIHHIHRNAIPKDITRIRSDGAVRAVLEIGGGRTDELGITEGDIIKSPYLASGTK